FVGSKSRDVLMTLDEWKAREAAMAQELEAIDAAAGDGGAAGDGEAAAGPEAPAAEGGAAPAAPPADASAGGRPPGGRRLGGGARPRRGPADGGELSAIPHRGPGARDDRIPCGAPRRPVDSLAVPSAASPGRGPDDREHPRFRRAGAEARWRGLAVAAAADRR